jgi:signal peptidase I
LAVEVLRSFGTIRLRVTGASMLPAIWPGDVLWISRCSFSEMRVGEIALFVRYGRLFAHRAIAWSDTHLGTRGDGNPNPDPPVNQAEFLGKVDGVMRAGRMVRIDPKPSLLRRAVSGLARRSVAAARVLVRLHHLQHRMHP